MMELVPKLDDVEAAAVHVEVDVTFLEVGCDGLPNLDLRMHRFNRPPGCLADALAMDLGQHEKQFQFTPGRFFVYTQDYAAHLLAVQDNAVSLCWGKVE